MQSFCHVEAPTHHLLTMRFWLCFSCLIYPALTYEPLQVYYIATSRELKRLDSLALSPIFGNFNESLQGLLTLRAFRKQDQFIQRNQALLDKSNRCWWPIQVVNRYTCFLTCLSLCARTTLQVLVHPCLGKILCWILNSSGNFPRSAMVPLRSAMPP